MITVMYGLATWFALSVVTCTLWALTMGPLGWRLVAVQAGPRTRRRAAGPGQSPS